MKWMERGKIITIINPTPPHDSFVVERDRVYIQGENIDQNYIRG